MENFLLNLPDRKPIHNSCLLANLFSNRCNTSHTSHTVQFYSCWRI